MSPSGERAFLEKYRPLTPVRQGEVEQLLDFLWAAEARAQAADRLEQSFRKLDELGLPPMSAEEIQAEIDAARADRRSGADRRGRKGPNCRMLFT